MKKSIRLSIVIMILLLWTFVLLWSVWNKEIVREHFWELKIEIDNWNNLINSQYHLKDSKSPVHFLGNSYYRNSEEDQKMMFVLSPYGLLFSSPDYDAILQTDIYYEGQEPDGFYNSETFINSIKNIYYTYVVSDVQWKGRNQYDVCIKGALSYRGSHWDEEGENVFVRWPFRIDICYPFTRKGWEILLNVEKYNKD